MTSKDIPARITLRLSNDDYEWILEEIEDTGATITGYIRMLIRKARKAEAAA